MNEDDAASLISRPDADPAFLRAVLDHGMDMVFVIDDVGTLRYASPSALWVLGYEPKSFLGRSVIGLVHPEQREEATEALGRSIDAGPGVLPVKVLRIRHADGSYRHLEMASYNMLDDPAVRGFVISGRDVTDRVEAETALSIGEERYRTIVELASEGIWTVDADSVTTFVNPAMAAMLGYETDEMIGHHLFDFLDEEARVTMTRRLQRRRQGITERRDEFRLVHNDGHTVWTLVSATPILGEDREFRGSLALVTDLSAHRDAEARFEALVRHSSDIITVLEPDGTLRWTNPAAARMLGYPREFEPDGGIFTLIHPDDLELSRQKFADLHTGALGPEDAVILRIRAYDGGWRSLETVATNLINDPAVRGIVLNSRDVSDRLEAEEALKASERRFRAVVQNASDVVNITNADGIMTYTSPSMERMLGYTPGDVVGMQARDLMHPDDVKRVEQTVAEQWAAGIEEPIEYRVRHRDGSWRIVEALVVNLFDEPEIAGVVGTMRDITDRVEAEAALVETRERFAALARHTTDLVTVSSAQGIMSYVSPSAKEILGYEADELEGTNAQLLSHPDDAAALLETITAHVAEGTAPPLLTYRVRHKDGSWRTLEGVTQNLLDEPSVRGVVTNSRDVTDRRAAEQKAAQLTAILEVSNEIIVLSDPSGYVVYANQAARKLLGPQEHQHVSELSSPESRDRLRTEIMPIVRCSHTWSGELELMSRTGVRVPVAATVQAHRDEGGKVELIATIAHDISELKAAQDRLEHEATHDSLTGLPNRALFREIGERALARSARAGDQLAVLFLDLDGFKLVNDGYGHDTGDRLLAQVAQRLREAVRLGDTLARLGGDEFVVLCEHPENKDQMLELSRRLIDVVSQPFRFDEHEVRVGASVGIAFGGDASSGIGGMIREADIALYQAKHEGRGRAELFDDSLIER